MQIQACLNAKIVLNVFECESGGTGRRTGLRILRVPRESSSLSSRTSKNQGFDNGRKAMGIYFNPDNESFRKTVNTVPYISRKSVTNPH